VQCYMSCHTRFSFSLQVRNSSGKVLSYTFGIID